MSDCGLFPIPVIRVIVIQQRAFYSEMPRLCVRTLPHVKIFCHNGKHTSVCGIKFIRLFRKILAFFLQGIAETGFAGTGYAALGFVPAEKVGSINGEDLTFRNRLVVRRFVIDLYFYNRISRGHANDLLKSGVIFDRAGTCFLFAPHDRSLPFF